MYRSLRLSPSSVSTFFKCSMQYKLLMIDELQPDPGSDNLFAVLGLSIHKASELNDIFDLTYDELRKALKIIFLSYMSGARNLPKDLEYQKFLSRGYKLLRNVFELKKRWKDSTIIDVERYYRIAYENPFIENVYLSGKIDIVIKNIELIFTALDWKTSKSKNKNINNDLQLTFYIYFVHVVYGIDYENIFGALAYPENNDILFTQRTEDEINLIMFDKINLMLSRITNDDFKKEPKLNDNLNDCTFCPYILSCDKL